MNIHEYQGRDVFRQHGLPVPPGKVADSADKAVAIAKELGLPVMVKAQVLTGGGGGGVIVLLSDASILTFEGSRISVEGGAPSSSARRARRDTPSS